MGIKKIDKTIINYITNKKISVLIFIYVGLASFASVYFFKSNELEYFNLLITSLNSNIFIGFVLIPVATVQAVLVVDILKKNLLFQQRFFNKKEYAKQVLKITFLILSITSIEIILFLMIFSNIFSNGSIVFLKNYNFLFFLYYIVEFLIRITLCAFIVILLQVYFNKIFAIFLNIFLGMVILFDMPIFINNYIPYKSYLYLNNFSITLAIINYFILCGVTYILYKIIISFYGKKMFEGVYK